SFAYLVSARHYVICSATLTLDVYTLSLHDALPICVRHRAALGVHFVVEHRGRMRNGLAEQVLAHDDEGQSRRPDVLLRSRVDQRSEEHTSELQSLRHLVCRLLPGTRNRSSGLRLYW